MRRDHILTDVEGENVGTSAFSDMSMFLDKDTPETSLGVTLDSNQLMASEVDEGFMSSEFQNSSNLRLRFGISSGPDIIGQSYGEVKSSETLLYRSGAPVVGGLQDATIFGPTVDYQCLCKKYKRRKDRGKRCDKCGVSVISSRVRRVRMGHIELPSPVVHIWFLKALPSYLALMLDMPLREIERVLYFEDYVVVDPGMTPLERGKLLKEKDYQEAVDTYGEDEFDARMGAEAIEQLLLTIDIDHDINVLREAIPNTTAETRLKKYIKRLRFLEEFKASGNKPHYMVLRVLPVLPPDLRPIITLDGGRVASSDLNAALRSIVNRVKRLKRFQNENVPDIIARNEKRILQEAVDTLFDNGRRGRPVIGNNKKPLKSLTDGLKGKNGLFRQNLLGKRVDYSGRSVIVVGPSLRLDQFGLPKEMALELFKPFIFHKLIFRGLASTIKVAKKLVEERVPEVWNILAEVIKGHPLLLNRAPTLHRLGLQAFDPVLVEGKAIQLHPLVCSAFNADFDGDQMAVHVPMTLEAQAEARVLMMSTNNILSPANGEPVITPTKDIVLGLYYLTRDRINAKGEGSVFASVEELERFYETGHVALHAKVKVPIEEVVLTPDNPLDNVGDKLRGYLHRRVVETTVGRALLSKILPEGLSFDLINKTLRQPAISTLLKECYRQLGAKTIVAFVDQLKDIGFEYATKSGISLCITDLVVPQEKDAIIRNAESSILEIQAQAAGGLLTHSEEYNKIIDIWSDAKDKVGAALVEAISTESVINAQGLEERQPSFNSMFVMMDSGARGSFAQMQQLSGMRGLMTNANGSIIMTAITANFREGSTGAQTFNAASAGRGVMADTSTKTAVGGHLSRRITDVAANVTVVEEDCGTMQGFVITSALENASWLRNSLLGRVLAEDYEVLDEHKTVLLKGTLIKEKELELLEKASVRNISVRSPVTCNAKKGGVCVQCYGVDLARGQMVSVGEAVGVIAAQSIGEPGTQLTMRTFHSGGVASRVAVANNIQTKTKGILKFHNIKFVQHPDGHLVTTSRSGKISVEDSNGQERERYKVPYGASILLQENAEADAGTVVAEWDPHIRPIISEVSGQVKLVDLVEGVTVNEQIDEVTGLSSIVVTDVKRRGANGKELRPMIKVIDDQGNDVCFSGTQVPAHYFLPIDAILNITNDSKVSVGDMIARIPQETSKTQDITGGLPRVSDLFEARKPKEPAILAEIEGVVCFGKETKGKKRLIVTSSQGEAFEILVPKWRNIIVFEGEHVDKGEVLTDGPLNPHDALRLLGLNFLVNYIVNEVQDAYRLQGVNIHDKHIEIIVREMLRNVSIVDPGDGYYLVGEELDEKTASKINAKLIAQNKKPMVYRPILTRVSLQSLRTDSPISGAAFQNMVQRLIRAAATGETDDLTSFKSSLILGRLMHAGTGFVRKKIDKSKAFQVK